MITDRMTATIVGILFITGTVMAILSIVFLGSTLDAPDYLVNAPENETRVVIAVICELILAVSVMAIGFMLYPILKKDIESLAVSYVVLRLTEAILIIVASISLLSLLTLSQDFVGGAADAASYQPSGASLLALRDWAFIVGTMIFLGLGGLPLYYLLYRSRLVPRWLSVWGLIGATLVFVYGLISLFDLDPAFLAAPIALQEMVFAVRLIVRGWDSTAKAAESA